MVLLDGMIQTRRFSEFVSEFIRRHNREQDEKATWEFYLHRVYDMTFQEFLDTLPKETEKAASAADIAATITDSASMLNAFDPCQNPVNQSE